LVLGIGTRLALDAGTYRYYEAALLVAALCWDLLSDRPVPVATVAAFVILEDPTRFIALAGLRAPLLLGFVFGAAILIATSSTRPARRTRRANVPARHGR
jgi:hypothetical protein